jgi:hypothetical protein
MTRLLRRKLPRSTNFGNATLSTQGVPCVKAGYIGSPSARNADFAVTQTHLFLASLGQRLFGYAEETGRIFQCISEFISDFGPSNQGLGRSIFFGPPLGTDEARAEREMIHLSLAGCRKQRLDGRFGSGPEALAAGLVAPLSSVPF